MAFKYDLLLIYRILSVVLLGAILGMVAYCTSQLVDHRALQSSVQRTYFTSDITYRSTFIAVRAIPSDTSQWCILHYQVNNTTPENVNMVKLQDQYVYGYNITTDVPFGLIYSFTCNPLSGISYDTPSFITIFS